MRKVFVPKIRRPSILVSDIVKKVPSLDSLPLLPRKSKLKKLNKKSRRRLTRFGLVVGNLVLLLGIGIFIFTNRSTSQTIRSGTINSAISTSASQQNPLDQLSSAQIALTAAQMAQLPEIKAVRSQADSDSILLAQTPSDTTILAKPQIVPTTQKSKQGIVNYVTQAGDTISSIADKHSVSVDSVRWSNNLAGNVVAADTKLVIPPVNGIVYTVKAGDTPAGLAAKYRADESQIVTYNDAELSGLTAGDQIIIPNGQKTAPLTYGVFVASYGGNGYDFGYCTYYAASKVSVPNNWGNANTWDNYAAASGWTVSTAPKPGAVAQSDSMSYLGHVAVVEAVSADGTMMKYSDMNGLAGWGRVGTSDWTPISKFQHYIYQ